MGSVFSSDVGLSPEELLHLQAETGFSKANIQRLHNRFNHLDKEKKGYLVKKDMMTIPEVIYKITARLQMAIPVGRGSTAYAVVNPLMAQGKKLERVRLFSRLL
jgi:hypothetical protein